MQMSSPEFLIMMERKRQSERDRWTGRQRLKDRQQERQMKSKRLKVFFHCITYRTFGTSGKYRKYGTLSYWFSTDLKAGNGAE